jgi:hypothetical protein
LVVSAASDPRVEIWDAERKAGLLGRVLDVPLEFRWMRAERARPARGARVPRLRLAAG